MDNPIALAEDLVQLRVSERIGGLPSWMGGSFEELHKDKNLLLQAWATRPSGDFPLNMGWREDRLNILQNEVYTKLGEETPDLNTSTLEAFVCLQPGPLCGLTLREVRDQGLPHNVSSAVLPMVDLDSKRLELAQTRANEVKWPVDLPKTALKRAPARKKKKQRDDQVIVLEP